MPLHTFTSPEGEEYEVSGPDGSTREQAFGILQEGIKTGYYKPKAKKGFTPATIPGQEGEAERVASLKAQRAAQPGSEKLKDILGGLGETALSLGTGMYAGVQAPITAGLKRAVGMVPDWEKETSKQMEEHTYAPRGEKGQEYTQAAGDFVNRYLAPFGLAGPRALAGLPDLVGRAKLKTSKEISVPPIATNREMLIRGKQAEVPTKRGLTVDQIPEETRLAQENLNKASQADMFVDEPVEMDHTAQLELPLTDDPTSGMVKRNIEASDQLDLFEHKQPDVPDLRAAQMEEMYAERPQTDENVALRQGQEQAKLAQEEQLQALEQQLIEQQYSPSGDGQGPKTRAAKSNINKFGQGGQAPLIGDLAEGIVKAGRGLKARFTGKVPPQPDTVLTPRSEATISAKVEKGSKAAAIGMQDSVYLSPSTIEEVVAKPGKDISSITQEAGAGMYAAIRRNSPNRMMSYTNRVFTDARLNKIKDSVQYITGKEGYNNKLTKLSAKEKQIIHMDSLIFDRDAIPFTHEKAVELGYTPAMEEFMNQRMASNGRVLELSNKVNAKLGLEPIDARVSYAAANFDGAYRTLVGKWHGEGKNRQFKIDTVVNGNSLWELKKGVEWAKENVPGAEFLELPRRGLNTQSIKEFRGVKPDSMSKLLTELAGMDPKFAAAKAAIDAHIELQTKKLYGHDVHAIEKKGVRGAIGDRPWLDAERNASDFFKQEVNHIEEGLQYWNYQDAINETRQMTARPELAHMKNTVQYIDKYLQNIHGQGLNPLGAAINSIVDTAFAATGFGSASTSKGVFNAAREAASLWMMGMFNTTFPAIQLSQFLTGMAPESVRIRSEFGLNPVKIATSLSNSTFTLSMLAAADLTGKSMDTFPSHLVDAYKWAKEHGITQYNEVEQSHSATQNPKWSAVKDVAGLPISVPERITGPQTFMWAVDMLHDAGLRGDDLHRAAYNASKYAMTEYHPDEAPLVYQRLGVAGPNVGGLKKFVHNSIDQQVARYGEAFKHPAAASTLIGMTLLTAGVTGLMGTAMLDKASLALTDKGLRDHWDDVMGKSITSKAMRDGVVSALSGYDWQARYSLADTIPGSFLEAAAGPHLSMLGKTIIAIHEYAKHRDEQSFREMAKAATPSGMKGMLEEGYMLGDQGQVLDKNAMNKYPPEMARTPTEHKVRQWGGPKPLRERLYDEQKYQADVVQQRIEKKRSEAVTRLTASMGLKDEEGFKKALAEFIKAEGDVSTLDQSIQKYYEQQMLSSKQRAGGLEPKATVPSIKKWERYQDK